MEKQDEKKKQGSIPLYIFLGFIIGVTGAFGIGVFASWYILNRYKNKLGSDSLDMCTTSKEIEGINERRMVDAPTLTQAPDDLLSPATSYSQQIALYGIRLIGYNYLYACNPNELEKLPQLGFVEGAGPRGKRESFLMVYTPAANVLTLVFRGALSSADWMNDFNFKQTKCKFTRTDLMVSKEFQNIYLSMREEIISIVSKWWRPRKEKQPTVLIVGHGLGGALASMCALDLTLNQFEKKGNKPTQVLFYSYGSPRVGNRKYARMFDKYVKSAWRVVNIPDMVPQLPPIGIDNFVYEHTKNHVDFDDNMKTMRMNHIPATYYHGIEEMNSVEQEQAPAPAPAPQQQMPTSRRPIAQRMMEPWESAYEEDIGLDVMDAYVNRDIPMESMAAQDFPPIQRFNATTRDLWDAGYLKNQVGRDFGYGMEWDDGNDPELYMPQRDRMFFQ